MEKNLNVHFGFQRDLDLLTSAVGAQSTVGTRHRVGDVIANDPL